MKKLSVYITTCIFLFAFLVFFSSCDLGCAHVVDEWTVTKEAHCEEIGSKTGICTLCGESVDMPIVAPGHDWEVEDCISGKYCKVCQKTESSEFNHKKAERFRVDTEEWGVCRLNEDAPYPRVNGYYCEDCDTAINLRIAFLGCGELTLTETYTDERGQHEVYTLECAVCGLSFRDDHWTNSNGLFKEAKYREYTVKRGEEVVWECAYKEQAFDHTHEFEKHVERYGESCTDGFLLTKICSVCGYSESQEFDECYTEWQEVDLSPWVPCGGRWIFEACIACRRVVMLEPLHLNCWNLEGEGPQSWTDEDGVTHVRDYATCLECGAGSLMEALLTPTGKPCEISEIQTVTLFVNGEPLYSMSYDRGIFSQHQKAYFTDAVGHECETGDVYSVRETCLLCGETETIQMSSHFSVREKVMTDCGGEISVGKCICCRKTIYPPSGSNVQFKCDFVTVEEREGLIVERCSVCGITRTEIYTDAPVKDYLNGGYMPSCYVDRTSEVTYIDSDGEELISFTDEGGKRLCEIVNSFELLGESCEDGCIHHSYCRICGEGTSFTYNMHMYSVDESYDLSDFGLCGGDLRYTECPCGIDEHLLWSMNCAEPILTEWSYEEDGVVYDVVEYFCADCGCTVEWIEHEETIGCRVYYDVGALRVLKDGEEQFSASAKGYSYVRHALSLEDCVLLGEKCEDGVLFEGICTVCGNYVSETDYSDFMKHNRPFTEIKIPEGTAGICGGNLLYHYCACGTFGEINNRLSCDFGDLAYEETDDEAQVWFGVYVCSKCGLRREMTHVTHDDVDGHYVYVTERYLLADGTVLIPDFSYMDVRHR